VTPGRARRGRWDDPWQAFPASRPLPVDGGLATRRQRGSMADTWWSRRFVEVLESYGLGARMQRGRRYARAGQVMSMDVSPGLVAAQVQGSRRTPYLVTVSVPTPTPQQWRGIDEALSARIGLAAAMLAGEVPMDLEDVFAEAGTPLLPRRWSELSTRCSCPDGANPCKHIAAVLYVFADRLDTDPWLLLEWRGRTREQVLASVGLAAQDEPEAATPPWWPLRPGEGPVPSAGVLTGPLPEPPTPPDAVLRRLEPLDVIAWRQPVTDALGVLYSAIQAPPDGTSDDRV
jgi:uncharacterized Zn finger protein